MPVASDVMLPEPLISTWTATAHPPRQPERVWIRIAKAYCAVGCGSSETEAILEVPVTRELTTNPTARGLR
jgi:hypothetical protein